MVDYSKIFTIVKKILVTGTLSYLCEMVSDTVEKKIIGTTKK